MSKTKSERLTEGGNALATLDAVGRINNEGGDGGEDTDWYTDYRVWPADGYTKSDVLSACEDHYADGYMLSASRTADKHDFVYITVRTT